MPLSGIYDGKAFRGRGKSEDLPVNEIRRLSGKKRLVNSFDLFNVFSLEIIP